MSNPIGMPTPKDGAPASSEGSPGDLSVRNIPGVGIFLYIKYGTKWYAIRAIETALSAGDQQVVEVRSMGVQEYSQLIAKTLTVNSEFTFAGDADDLVMPAESIDYTYLKQGAQRFQVRDSDTDTKDVYLKQGGGLLQLVGVANETTVDLTETQAGWQKFTIGLPDSITIKGSLTLGNSNIISNPSTGTVDIDAGLEISGDLKVEGNDINDSGGSAAISFDGQQNTSILGTLDVTGNTTINGTFTVDGGTTTINSSDLTVTDTNINLGNVGTPTDLTADGGGIILLGTANKTILWDNDDDTWHFNQGITVNTSLYVDRVGYIDRVGINTATPDRALDVAGNANEGGIRYVGAAGANSILEAGNSGLGGIDFKTVDSTSQPYNHFLFNDGYVGIGTSGPDRKLDVSDAANPQLRLTRTDGSVFVDFEAGSNTSGDLYINPDHETAHAIILNVDNNVDPGYGTTIKTDGAQSQVKGWQIDYLGGADFRYLYTDELHAKAFIADLEQALAGGQIISKSVAILAVDFTAPDNDGTADLIVEDLPSAENMAVFEANDHVRLRTFDRSGGELTIYDCWGVVTGYTDGDGTTYEDKTQKWTFTRASSGNGGAISQNTVIKAGSLILDYGTDGNGYYEVNAIDGENAANSPYAQIVTWTDGATGTGPGTPNAFTVNARLGNLKGVHPSGSTEYGLFAGDGSATTDSYLLLSESSAELHNLPLRLFKDSSETIKLEPGLSAEQPYIAVGTSLIDGTWGSSDKGFLVKGSATDGAELYIGSYDGNYLKWVSNTLTVSGVIHVASGGSYSGDSIPESYTDADATDYTTNNTESNLESGTTITSGGIQLSTGGSIRTTGIDYDGTGIFFGYHGSDYKLSLKGATQYLKWNGSTLDIKGNITMDGGSISWNNVTTSGTVPYDTAGSASDVQTNLNTLDTTVTTQGTYIDGSGIYTGTLTASQINGLSLNIGGTDANSWHVDTNGNMWWGSGGSYSNATIKISSAGSVDFTTGTFSGDVSIGGTTLNTTNTLNTNTNWSDVSGTANAPANNADVTNYNTNNTQNNISSSLLTISGGGLNLTNSAAKIYSGSKSSYNSSNQGFFLGGDGTLGVGNATSYIQWDSNTLSVAGEIKMSKASFSAGNISIGLSGSWGDSFSGTDNIAIGGFNSGGSGTGNVQIGVGAGRFFTNPSNTIIIGHSGNELSGSNRILIGTSAHTDAWIGGSTFPTHLHTTIADDCDFESKDWASSGQTAGQGGYTKIGKFIFQFGWFSSTSDQSQSIDFTDIGMIDFPNQCFGVQCSYAGKVSGLTKTGFSFDRLNEMGNSVINVWAIGY